MVYKKYAKVSKSFEAKNAEMNGTLAANLRQWRKANRSFMWIATRLSESGMYVAASTVGNWLKELGVD